jgi:hypothetical protein
LWAAAFLFFTALYALVVPLATRLGAAGVGAADASLILGAFGLGCSTWDSISA